MPWSVDKERDTRGTTFELDDLGWIPDPAPTQSSVEAARSTGWLVARIWSTPCTITAQALPLRTIRIVVAVEGAAEGTVNGKRFELSAGQFIFLGSSDEVTFRNDAFWARFEWILHYSTSGTPVDACRSATRLPDGYQQLIGALTNTLVMAPSLTEGHGTAPLLEMLSGALTSLVVSASDLPPRMTPRQLELFHQAMAVIEEQHSNPAFNVQALSRHVSVSMSTLHAAFQAAGTTPRRALEGRRVKTAKAILTRTPMQIRGSLERAAQATGFSSTKQLRSALARHSKEHPVEKQS